MSESNGQFRGWFKVPNRIVDEALPKMTGAVLGSYLVLRRWLNDGTTWCTLATIAEKTGNNRGTVKRAIDTLIALGEVEIAMPGKKGTATVYRVRDEMSCAGATKPEMSCAGAQMSCAGARKSKTKVAQARTHSDYSNTTQTTDSDQKARGEAAALVPLILQTPEFLKAWDDWQTYRKQRKQTLTPKTIEKQLAKLAAMGPEQAVASINQSIEQGWQGLFEPKGHHDDNENRRGSGLRGDAARKRADKAGREYDENLSL